jgi:histidinol-phosphate aminotransferase
MSLFLDKNENPFDLPGDVKKHVLEKIAHLPFNRYPDPDYTALREKLSAYCGFPADLIVPGNGGDEILWMAFSSFVKRGDAVLAFSPTFSEYYRLADLFGAELHTVPADLEGGEPRFDHAHFLQKMSALKPSLVLIDSPNNPTGQAHPLSFIGEAAALCESTIVIDEAYGEFSKRDWLSSMRGNTLPENVVVLKTLSKAWGLAGIRLGYAVCGKRMAGRLNNARAPFNINILSRTAAETVLDNAESLFERIESFRTIRDDFVRKVNGIPGWKAFSSEANFVLVKAPLPRSVIDTGKIHCKFPPLSQESEDSTCWIRVSIGTQEDMNAVAVFFSTIQRR